MAQRKPPQYDHTFKIITIGESMAGKTSIINRFTKDERPEGTMASIGIEFQIKRMEY